MNYYPEPDSHIRDKVKVVSDLLNQIMLLQKNDIMLQALIYLIQRLKKYFIALEAKIDKLDINKLVNVSTSSNKLKSKVNNLDIGKLKTIPADLKIQVMQWTKLLKNAIPDATTLIHINRYNTDKQNIEKKLEMLIKKYQIQVI